MNVSLFELQVDLFVPCPPSLSTMLPLTTTFHGARNDIKYISRLPNSIPRSDGELPIQIELGSNFDAGVLVDTGVVGQPDSMVTESLSTESVSTAATFGPLITTNHHSELWPTTMASPPMSLDDEFDCQAKSPVISLFKAVSEVSDPPSFSRTSLLHGGYFCDNCRSPTVSRSTLSEYLDPEPLRDSTAFPAVLDSPTRRSHQVQSSPISRVFRSTGNIPHQGPTIRTDLKEPYSLQYRTPFQTLSTMPSPAFVPPSPSGSSSGDPASPSSSFFRRTFRLRSPGRDSPTRVKNIFTATENSPGGCSSPPNQAALPSDLLWPESVPCSPVTTTAPAGLFRRERLNSSTTISSVASCSPAPTIHMLKAPKTPKFEYLPDKLLWLRNIKLDLCIDQEGFRAIQASFRLVGYSERTRSLEPFGRNSDTVYQVNGTPSDLYAGIVDFMPVRRQIFVFHRSTLDSSPVLRRITVNGDESRDYLSRQASLTLKNGVYTVRGHETSSLSSLADSTDIALSDADPSAKLKWKLEYIVQDRRAETSGKILQGEKTLTPLTFSCSPLLLHSLQGKKVRLMHVVKKSVTAKILAERLEPPKPPISKPVLLPSSLKANTFAAFNAVNTSKGAWNMHRRAFSHAEEGNMPPGTLSSGSKRAGQRADARPIRRRRASSAGERSFRKQTSDKSVEVFPPVRNIASQLQLDGISDLASTHPARPPGYRAGARPARARI